MRTSYLAVAYTRRLALNNRLKIILRHWINLRDKFYIKLSKIDISSDLLIITHRRRISSGIRHCTYQISTLRKNIRETENLLNRIPLG